MGIAVILAMLLGFGFGAWENLGAPGGPPKSASSRAPAAAPEPEPEPEPSRSPEAAPPEKKPSPSPASEKPSDEPSDDTLSAEGDCQAPSRTIKIPLLVRERQADGTYTVKERHRTVHLPGYDFCGSGSGSGSGSVDPSLRNPGMRLPKSLPTLEANQPGWPHTGPGGSSDSDTRIPEYNRVPIVTPHDTVPHVAPVRPPAPRAPRVPFVF